MLNHQQLLVVRMDAVVDAVVHAVVHALALVEAHVLVVVKDLIRRFEAKDGFSKQLLY